MTGMKLFDRIFNRHSQKKPSGQKTESKRLSTLEDFPGLSSMDRMGVIMIMGNSGKHEFFPFLQYAIVWDEDINVKFAALKRIHLFRDHPDTITLMTEMKNNHASEHMEPYFSMALSRLGIISLEEFENKIKTAK